NAVGAELCGEFHLLGQRVHEQADATAAVVQSLEDRPETLAVGAEIPALVAGESIGAVRDERALRWPSLADEVVVAVERIALDVELGRRVAAKKLGNLQNVIRAYVPLVGARVDRD